MAISLEEDRHHRRAVIFLLAAAVHRIYQDQLTLVVEHSFGDGYYCHFAEVTPPSTEMLQKIQKAMEELRRQKPALAYLKATPKHWRHLNAPRQYDQRPPLIKLGDFISPSYEFTTLDLKKVPTFELRPYDQGFLLRIGTEPNAPLPPFQDYPKLFQMMKQHEQWGRIMGVSTVAELNEKVRGDGFKEMIWVAEGLHEKRIAALADEISDRKDVRFIFVAGPSSSGKTTFTKRLKIQLKVNGYNAIQISMDDYFLNRSEMTPLPDGTLDFERLEALDIEALQRDLNTLYSGQPIRERNYDFHSGRWYVTSRRIVLNHNDKVIIEGIHALNPVITQGLAKEGYFKIYISALTQLNIDNHHPVSTSDSRLIRRLVRDHQFRGYSAEETLNRWQSVRYGEMHNIFPFQESADAMFNSSLVYEHAVLKSFALPLLKEAPRSTLRDRLINLLSIFHGIPKKYVPGTSILREFIGESYFHY